MPISLAEYLSNLTEEAIKEKLLNPVDVCYFDLCEEFKILAKQGISSATYQVWNIPDGVIDRFKSEGIRVLQLSVVLENQLKNPWCDYNFSWNNSSILENPFRIRRKFPKYSH